MIEKRVDWILRIGLAFAFLYPPIDAIFDPNSWLGYFPSWMHGYVPDLVLLHSFGAVEVIIALWLLSGWKIFWPSCLALLMLLAIVIFDSPGGAFEVLFRDLAIASIALALAVAHFPKRLSV
jgi:uncharacterized membrane protein YphA (DoxX/SURF4 family)